MSIDLDAAREAVRRVSGYLAGAESIQGVALKMAADTSSPFFDFDPIAHGSNLDNLFQELFSGAIGAFDDEASDDA
jgi:hypothetical protein